MAYTEQNFRTKKALKIAVANGEKVYCYSPGPFAVVPGPVNLEGPHYPAPHTWYATAVIDKDLCIVPGSVK